MADITEFTWLDTEELHLVGAGANGFSPLLAKARLEVDEVVREEAEKAFEVGNVLSGDGMVKFVSAAARRKMADSGVAMPNGDFPIADQGHLRSAIGRLAEYKGDKGAAKAHIVKRAKALGLTHILPKEWNVTKEVSTEESLSQTHEVSEDPPEHADPSADDGGEPRHVAAEDKHIDTSDGTGDTAPDKSLPKDEAESQTAKAEVDGTGSKAPDEDADDAEAKDEAKTQTDDVEKKGSKDSDPGSPEWEAKDVALGEKAEALIEQLGEVVRTFTEREKAEGDGAKKSGRRLSGSTEGAIRRCIEALTSLLDNTHNQSPASKEMEDMTNDELIKLLDERDEARRAQKKAKAEKKAAKAAKAAEAADTEVAKGADASEATDGTDTDALTKAMETIAELQKTVDAISAQDAKRPMLNGAGVSAALRGPESQDALKAFDDNVAEAEDRLSKAVAANDTYAITAAKTDLNVARHQRTAIKMMASENARERDPQMTTRSLRGQGVPLLTNRHALPEDATLRAL